MCLRTPDLSVFREHSKASRYMIYSLLASRYLVNGKTNETLQHLNAAVVKDINEVMQKGIQCSSGDSCPADPETLNPMIYLHNVGFVLGP